MEAKHHLPHGATVSEDQGRPRLASSGRDKQLAVNLQTVFAFEDNLLGRD
jgi:hypothetical protein